LLAAIQDANAGVNSTNAAADATPPITNARRPVILSRTNLSPAAAPKTACESATAPQSSAIDRDPRALPVQLK
jgi:hypothetical protein